MAVPYERGAARTNLPGMDDVPRWALAVHGGAGQLAAEDLAPGAQAAIRQALAEALRRGAEILAHRGTSLDAVEASVRSLEDAPLFNAGRGAVFNAAGEHELDASIMAGTGLRAGAVAGVRTVKNPVSLARAVMEHSSQVLLHAAGAVQLAEARGLTLVEPSYFRTQRRWEAHQAAVAGGGPPPSTNHGTVGAVALDAFGHLAAATSTGGLAGKPIGRIGDSAIIGAGTYASDASCAVSGTGQGEYFIRATVARDIAALMEYGDKNLAEAARLVVHGRLSALGGRGGIIALDRTGHLAIDFSTDVMHRGAVSAGSAPWTAVRADDALPADRERP